MKWMPSLLVVFCFPVLAGYMDETESLEGMIIINSGTAQSVSCPPTGKYNCATWPMDLLEFPAKQVCFFARQARCSFSCKGFIAAGEDRRPYFYQSENIGDGLTRSPVEYVKCPDKY